MKTKFSFYNSRKLNRRSFFQYSTYVALGFTLSCSNQNKSTIIVLDKINLYPKLKEEITSYNNKREMQLKNSLQNEINRDHRDERTTWIGQKLYTYAELSNLTN